MRNEELRNLYSSKHIIRVITSGTIRQTRYLAHLKETKYVYKIFKWKSWMSKEFGVTMWTVLIYSGQGSVASYCEQNNECLGSTEGRNLLINRATMSFSGKILLHGFSYVFPKEFQCLKIFLPTPYIFCNIF